MCGRERERAMDFASFDWIGLIFRLVAGRGGPLDTRQLERRDQTGDSPCQAARLGKQKPSLRQITKEGIQ